MNHENFIWTELIAFDNASPDKGVDAYINRIGYVPTGISLLLSHPDIILLHKGMDSEIELFQDVCSRQGHGGNEERARQKWTNYDLRDLASNLQNRGVLVFCSVFATYVNDMMHQEWASDHKEALIVYDTMGETYGIELIARLNDGTYLEDFFTSQLERVMLDYGFDGYHGPDCMGPGGAISHTDFSDNMVQQFCEYLGDRAPAELKVPLYDASLPNKYDIEKLTARAKLIWYNYREDWMRFFIKRWTSCWTKISTMLKKHGKKSMINSANTKAVFESLYIYGIDYREIAQAGVDYILVECVAANMGIIYGGFDFHYDFLTTLADLKAFLPEMKVIFLHGVKDVVESYDLLRHAPGRLEREFFSLTNFYVTEKAGELSRCADGFMVCLGDGIKSYEWEYLNKQWELGYSFNPVKAGDFIWVWDDDAIDNLVHDYPKYGTWPTYKQISYIIANYDIQIQTIARLENVPNLQGNLIVPSADLLSKEKLEILKNYTGGKVVLMGNFDNIPDNTPSISCKIGDNYNLSCMVLNSDLNYKAVLAPCENNFVDEQSPMYFWIDPPSYLTIPTYFWDALYELISPLKTARVNVDDTCVNIYGDTITQEGLHLLYMEDKDENARLALVSSKDHYIEAKVTFDVVPEKVNKVSSFPYTAIRINEKGEFKCGTVQTPLHIPPFGVIVMDIDKK